MLQIPRCTLIKLIRSHKRLLLTDYIVGFACLYLTPLTVVALVECTGVNGAELRLQIGTRLTAQRLALTTIGVTRVERTLVVAMRRYLRQIRHWFGGVLFGGISLLALVLIVDQAVILLDHEEKWRRHGRLLLTLARRFDRVLLEHAHRGLLGSLGDRRVGWRAHEVNSLLLLLLLLLVRDG